MPKNAPKVKIQAVEGYNATITLCEPTLKARRETLEKIAKKTGAYVVHPFNEPKVIAGQGTSAMEMIEDIGDSTQSVHLLEVVDYRQELALLQEVCYQMSDYLELNQKVLTTHINH